jgi:putative sterol carrier protein
MSEKLKYLSAEWRDEAEKRLREKLAPEDLNGSTVSMSNTYLNCPDGTTKHTFIRFEGGKLSSYVLGTGEAPAADFSITAEYPVYVKMANGELTGQSAVMNGSMKLKGNILVAMKFASASEKVSKIMAAIPTEY